MEPPRLRVMDAGDVTAVMEIERGSFAAGWPRTAFARELSGNAMARYIVLEAPAPAQDGPRRLIGFGGIWLMLDEAHVVTVAVAPEFRRKGFGRMIVHGLVELARTHGMSVATLECRVSNEAARTLYGDYGFYEVGRRVHYYADNGEDAVIMTTERLFSEPYVERLGRLEAKLRTIVPGAIPGVSGIG
ncbi:MAG TPA: ribosomal protein S18-alanine N-acetyltransferase [Tepidiformaceae bacterium]|nr:ribosomal protein S18-alanine N-acetyltransferase [Tepidiformaceae bacterium]